MAKYLRRSAKTRSLYMVFTSETTSVFAKKLPPSRSIVWRTKLSKAASSNFSLKINIFTGGFTNFR